MKRVLFSSPRGAAQSLWFNRASREWQAARSLGCLYQSAIDASEDAPLARDLLNPFDAITIKEV